LEKYQGRSPIKILESQKSMFFGYTCVYINIFLFLVKNMKLKNLGLFKFVKHKSFKCWNAKDKYVFLTKSQNLSFNLNGNKIVCEDNVKLFGVTIDSDLFKPFLVVLTLGTAAVFFDLKL
jgi:hypothetical protein